MTNLLSRNINKKLCKAKKGIGILKKLYHFLPRSALLTTYKTFTRIHLDYDNIIYHQLSTASFPGQIEPVHYNAALVIARAMKGMLKVKLYHESGLEKLS